MKETDSIAIKYYVCDSEYLTSSSGLSPFIISWTVFDIYIKEICVYIKVCTKLWGLIGGVKYIDL